ncbi:hypothetical protein AB0L06_39585 [Spirillospora sp. NPDC052269]
MKAQRPDPPVRAWRPWAGLAATLVLTAALLAASVLCLVSAIAQGNATSRAAAGHGRPGTFVAEEFHCRPCSWYGSFTADDLAAPKARNRELRGAHESSVRAGQQVRVRDVGPFVQAEGGKAEWSRTISNSVGAFFFALFGVLSAISAAVQRDRIRRRA